ncbi:MULTISPECIES: sensor histidine kinase [Eisenbergiella]|nr:MULTISPECIES: HAMP domain-containing sensor histidine kinase [Eisenbergiella]MDY2652854.1 HAMP domain-containing sensor histidine kinase [Eisenbergiella porci]
MNRKSAGISALCLWMGGCMLACSGICLWTIRRSEAAFYTRASLLISAAPESAGKMMQALKNGLPEQEAAGAGLLKRYGYEAGMFAPRDFAGLAVRLLLCFLLLGAAGFFCYLWDRRRRERRIGELSGYLARINRGEYDTGIGSDEDEYSRLQDEIYKTVVKLRESREEAAEGRRKLSENLTDISHQLKTPLTSISLLQELLEEQTEGEEGRQLLARMEQQTEHIRGLVSSLLTLSRLDAGVLVLEKKTVDLQELLSSATEAVRSLTEHRKQKILTEGAEGLQLSCDLGWTGEALANILKNCSEHSPEGGRIFIHAQQNLIYTRIEIEDEGPGLAPEECKRIFDRFYQGRKSARENVGVGLSMAKSLIESQNGEIRAENRKNGGARFVIDFYRDGENAAQAKKN